MNDELRCVVGACSECLHLFVRNYDGLDENGEQYIFKCLVSLDDVSNGRTLLCSHFEEREQKNLFVNNDFRPS
jgi:hypothetical protein